MSLAIVYCRANLGIKAPLITVETHISNGIPAFSIVGLPETAVKESRDRVRSAILNSRFEFPARRITVNLAPADLPKYGSHFDLPIALSILTASQQISQETTSSYEFAGELALSGDLRGVRGILPFAIAAHTANKSLIIPKENAEEAKLIAELEVFSASSFIQVCTHLTGAKVLRPYRSQEILKANSYKYDLDEVRGQEHGKRALEIAAAGGHSILFFGPPGTGKSMLASRLPGILPNMTDKEALEVAAINSISCNGLKLEQWKQRPYRTPHHTASSVALVGGGSPPRPGEISLSHHGVLFLDELPEFNRHVLEALREPIESGTITISRAARQAQFPAQFQLIAAMNPCPCGYLGDSEGRCRCTSEQVKRYRAKISGPLLDRIDIHVEMMRVPETILTQKNNNSEKSEIVRSRVEITRKIQLTRANLINADLQGKILEQHCELTEKDRQMLTKAINKLKLSARAYHRVLRVARTIADLAQSKNLEQNHLQEALGYRLLDRY